MPTNPSSRPATPQPSQLPKSSPPLIGVPAGLGASGGDQIISDPLNIRLNSAASSPRSSISGDSIYFTPPGSPTSSQPSSRRSSISGDSIYFTPPGSPTSSESETRIRLPRFKGFSGKTLGELSNTLGELSSTLVALNKHPTPGSIATGVIGESLFGFGGVWQLVSALNSLNHERNITECLALLQGFANAISGTTGVVSAIPNTPLPAGVISQATWAIGEGANMIRQANQYWRVNPNWIDAEQTVCVCQFVASALKFTGIVAILSGGSSLWLVAEACGTLIAASCGIFNLRHKGHFTSMNLSAIRQYLEGLGTLRNIGSASRTLSGYNPNAHDMV
jgi:hypothetical protein